ncbi:Lumazine-binding protein [Nitrosococcus oceani ATCC 19707]|uniref:Riboflavin synthase n=2 Tax=Nitrosococcus oceani TaxID=1229 RepID=Q3J9L1_NITOC|nr:riboflavin synthase [Nitrosococcus oceani]ABA58485.1 Lumazine-binding protein [Nitrosococcus oceani ATCC 19707]EDZ67038.1 riboflavin synthase, alpha subunit [Nitrosococcus oceani AFC27]KFI19088.1 riboflavin synthase subunit alpha [Nitrosococcus oceani C-27]GEM18880.1 riboflavin synthase [Nitrosococcus oceani]
MFTGIIRAVGKVVALQFMGSAAVLRIDGGKLGFAQASIGDSIAVNGVCLTVTRQENNIFDADVSQETLSRTVLGRLQPGDRVNLEPALTLKDGLGGHLTSGHCDGVGTVVERKPVAGSIGFSIHAPANLAKYIAEKGSICVDGVSLTVNEVKGSLFMVNIIPHTLEATTLNEYHSEREVNLEVDLLARYLESLLRGDSVATTRPRLGESLLTRHNFSK